VSEVETKDTALVEAPQSGNLTMWNDKATLDRSWRQAGMLARSALVPEKYRGKQEDCLLALDIANRVNWPPLMVMQNLYVVKGNPSWSGQACIAIINGCGRFTPVAFRWQGERGEKQWGCTAVSTRLADGVVCESDTVTWQMALDEGWVEKSGSKWKTMPKQMMMYRAGAFFARVHCPDLLLGIAVQGEVEDVYGAEQKPKTVISIDAEVVDD
jgi:hypothetical protein